MLLTAFEYLPDAVFVIDPVSSNIVACNQAACTQVGLERESLVNHSVLSLQKYVVGSEQWASIAQAIREAKGGFIFQGTHMHSSGAEVPVEVNTSAFLIEGNEWFVSVARTIAPRLAQEQEAIHRQAQIRFALTEVSDGLWDWDMVTNDVYFSPSLKRTLGYGPHEMNPSLESWADKVHPDDAERVLAAIQQHTRGERERYDVEYRLFNRNGHYLWVWDRGCVCERDSEGKPTRMVGLVQNITERKMNELALLELASVDQLTGLRNRRECEHALAQKLELCKRLDVPLGICIFDLDHFKRINDEFGHAAGDAVLKRFAHSLQEALRSSDDLFRWGGEEFLLICTNTPLHDQNRLAEKLRHLVESLSWPEVPGLDKISTSIGIASFPVHAVNVTNLFMVADRALYHAKALGRNRVEIALPHEDLTQDVIAMRHQHAA